METTLISLVGKGILGKAISETYESFRHIQNHHPDHCQVKKTILQLDVLSKMESIHQILSSLNVKTNVIKMQIMKIKGCLESLKTDLKNINQITKEHTEKYFSYWRSADYTNVLESLKFNFLLLENRFDFLIKLLNVEKLASE